jgi:hypothetical protein
MKAHKSECPSGVGQVAEENTNTADSAIVGQHSKAESTLIALWRFAVNLAHLKNVSLALWVTDYELSPGCQVPTESGDLQYE